MTPPVFQTCMASTAVTDIIGDRLYQDEAEQGVNAPFVVWQMIGGTPENYINQLPDLDSYNIQFDCYAKDQYTVETLAKSLRDAVEPAANIVAWRGTGREQGTRLYRYSFDVEWMVPR
ncbi:DUF3168 domain-containing protein [Methylophaga sp. OBS4]|uniref:DUF3168 domain-containing protein n=1 Tax=Methylophaga sp. OBS4 TaxID=2991935 RepID=UPI0022571D0B|nr:DUF3168 domain-containing protein [Methylophaga sp. OBS4]MCX4186772.1 DUF3168 domain-containing protein [Methylophaga sp. OBS4]